MSFDEFAFLNKYLNSNLAAKNLSSTLNFSLLWALFEKEIFNNTFSADKLKQICSEKGIGINEFQDQYAYFKTRYIDENGDETTYFSSFFFRTVDNKPLIKDILKNDKSKDEDKIWALFKIIQRLRDNLFHGIKVVKDIELQEPNFCMANKVIARFLEVIKKQ